MENIFIETKFSKPEKKRKRKMFKREEKCNRKKMTAPARPLMFFIVLRLRGSRSH